MRDFDTNRVEGLLNLNLADIIYGIQKFASFVDVIYKCLPVSLLLPDDDLLVGLLLQDLRRNKVRVEARAGGGECQHLAARVT